MQGELAKLKAVRSSNVRGGRGVAHPLGPATLSPYHEKPSRAPARWGKASSPTRHTYFEQVRAKLEAERKLRAQHHKQNQMHRLTSVYGRRSSTSPRRGITRPRDRDPLLQAAKTPVVLPLFAPAGVAEAGSREVDRLESLKTNSTTTLVQDARAYAHHLSASAAAVTAQAQAPAPTEEAGVHDAETQGRGEDMARDSSPSTTAAGLQERPSGPLVEVGNLTQGSRPKTAPEGMAKMAAYHRLPATFMTPRKVAQSKMDGARLAQEVAAASSALASLGKLPRPNSAAGLLQRMRQGDFNGLGAHEWYHARRPSAVIKERKRHKALSTCVLQAVLRRHLLAPTS